MFRKVLIANRGEIAVRIIRTLRELGIGSVAIFSDADRDALFVLEADEAYHVGPSPAPQSYLNVESILSVARQAGVDAVHPGYGFLAENAPFAAAVQEAGSIFIGPSPEAIRVMGDKVEARRVAMEHGVPVVPGTPGPVGSLDEALAFGQDAGYPLAVKASGGGGGRGIRVVSSPDEMADALERARREAETYFKNPEVYLERYFPDPRHIEFQVLGDKHGHLVHLGERDCSVQRRHQKLIEETPSPALDRALRGEMGEMALRVAGAARYDSAGTVEFLLSREGAFYFLEMNTRIQVEHPVTESVTGTDLIREMILAAAGEHIEVCESVLDPTGHAIEIRINAEDPLAGFQPTPTQIARYREPGGIGIRMDSGVYAGYTIPQDYDSLMAKLIAWAPDRERARLRTLRALDEYLIEGPASTIPFSRAVLQHPVFADGEVGTTFVGDRMPDLEAAMRGMRGLVPAGPAAETTTRGDDRSFEVTVNRRLFQVSVSELQREKSDRERAGRRRHASTAPATNAVASPMHGTVIAVKKSVGDAVQEGEPIFIVEAMKMENEIVAHRSGTLTEISAEVGQTVESGQTLATIA
jgi:acetyl-CoA/propionyl-CoA/long-chain acyl-CoA carboxylase, biotin carboxylase, biotin carboxyl carrier protein